MLGVLFVRPDGREHDVRLRWQNKIRGSAAHKDAVVHLFINQSFSPSPDEQVLRPRARCSLCPPCTQTLADAGILILTRFCVCLHPTAGRSVQMLPDRRQTGHRLRVDGGVGMTPPACYTGTASENTMAKLRSISKLLLDSKHDLIEVQTNVFIRVEVSNASRRPTISWRC